MKLKKNEVLVLRTVNQDMTSGYGGHLFTWSKRGRVTDTNWKDHVDNTGLSGLVWGAGSYCFTHYPGPHLVLRVDTSRDFRRVYGVSGEYCEFKTGYVVYCGTQERALALIRRHAPVDVAVNSIRQDCRDKCRQVAGYYAAQFGRDGAIQCADAFSSQRANNSSWQRVGGASTQIAGSSSIQLSAEYKVGQESGHDSIQIAGSEARQYTQEQSVQIAGPYSYQVSRDRCYQKAGINTVQVLWPCIYGKQQTAIRTRVVGKREADKWYKTTDKGWNPCTKQEIALVLRRIDGVWKRGEK